MITLRLPFFYGWIVVGVAALGAFLSGPAQTFGVSVFIDPMLAELGWSRSTISAAYATGSFISGLWLLVYGPYLDRFGARRMISALAVLYGLTCFGLATVASPLGATIGFTALRILGQSSLVLSCTTLAALWFVRRRGLATSFTILGLAISNAVLPPLLQTLVTSNGWRTAYVIVGLTVWISLVLPAVVLIRDRPETIGLRPDGEREPLTLGQRSTPAGDWSWTPRQALRSRTFWLLVVATLAPSSVQTGLVFHQVSYFTSRGLSAELAALVLSAYAVVMLGTTFVVGFVLQRVAERYVLGFGLLLLAATTIWLMNVTTPAQGLVFGILLGLVGGTQQTTAAVIWSAYYGRGHLGSIRGVTQAAVSLSAASGPLLLSLPYDLLGSYTLGLWLMTALSLLCATAALLAGPPSAPPTRELTG